jgi:outer membrane protein assembly factor BamB
MRYLSILFVLSAQALADDWPHWMGPKRENVWRETGILEKFPAGGPKILWRAKVAGGYSGPAVANGRVYVGDFVSPVDTKIEVYDRTDFKGTERVLCFDQQSGNALWNYEYPMRYTISYPTGPRVTPCVNDGLVYFLGAEGRLSCVNAESGKLVWEKDYQKDYKAKTPLWGFAGHPFIDGDKLICITGGEGACVIALDKKTGKEIWRSLNTTEAGYSSPTIVEVGGKRLLLIWHAESVNALDPETGKRIWGEPLKPTNGAAIMVPILSGEFLFVGGFSRVCKGMKLTAGMAKPEVLWTGKKDTGLYPVNTQPFAEDGLLYGICQDGELRCVELATGKRLWESLDPVGGKTGQCVTALMVKNGDRFFLFNERGELIIAKLSREGYKEIDRAKIIEPTGRTAGRDVVFCAPAFANKCMYVRNDKELICVSLKAD